MEDNKYEPIISVPGENENYSNQQILSQIENIQYQYAYTCPRCINSSIHRFCDHCGLDAEEYAKQMQYQQQYAPQYQQPNQYQQQQNYYQPQFQQGYYQAQTYPRKKSKTGFIITIVVVVFVALIVGISIFAGAFLKNDNSGNGNVYRDETLKKDGIIPNGVSDDEFKLIKTGMSYAQISSIIGGDGFLSNQGETPLGENFNTFQWISETNSEKFYYITFINDASTEITVE